MTVLINETFSSGIPGGFATAYSGSGSMTPSYNAGEQAVDLTPSDTTFYYHWLFTSLTAKTALRVELDFQQLTIPSNCLFGVGLVASAASPGVFSVGMIPGDFVANYWYAYYTANWGSSWSGSYGTVCNTVGRGITRVDTYVVGSIRRIAIYRDGFLGWIGQSGVTANVIPSFLGYGAGVRLHKVYATDTPTDVESLIYDTRLLQGKVTGSVAALSGLTTTQDRITGDLSKLHSRDARLDFLNNFGIPDHRSGYLEGTLKRKIGTAKLPYNGVLLLIRETDFQVIASGKLNESGYYRFDDLSAKDKYMLVAHDYITNYRAVADDGRTPTLY
jgi:hypothetical protein